MYHTRNAFQKLLEAFQFIQRQLKRRHEVLEEVFHRTHALFVQRLFNGPLRLNKFTIARAKLLQSFQICRELVRRLDQLIFVGGSIRLDAGGKGRSELCREHGEQLVAGPLFELAGSAPNVAV